MSRSAWGLARAARSSRKAITSSGDCAILVANDDPAKVP